MINKIISNKLILITGLKKDLYKVFPHSTLMTYENNEQLTFHIQVEMFYHGKKYVYYNYINGCNLLQIDIDVIRKELMSKIIKYYSGVITNERNN